MSKNCVLKRNWLCHQIRRLSNALHVSFLVKFLKHLPPSDVLNWGVICLMLEWIHRVICLITIRTDWHPGYIPHTVGGRNCADCQYRHTRSPQRSKSLDCRWTDGIWIVKTPTSSYRTSTPQQWEGIMTLRKSKKYLMTYTWRVDKRSDPKERTELAPENKISKNILKLIKSDGMHRKLLLVPSPALEKIKDQHIRLCIWSCLD